MNSQLKKSLTTLLKNTYDTHEKSIKKTLPEKQFRKIKKLANNPELFVKDMVAKRGEQVRKYIPIKHNGHFQYTVVSAVYNVEKYLDEYFESLVNQSLDFKKHIHLILVDDGSTDNSAEIIKKWQNQFPNNITYLYKENGGIASARNLGLQHVKTEWVTFIDSDDKVHSNYFKVIDDVLAQQENIALAVGNLHLYFEANQSIQDNHSLKSRFNKKLNIIPIKELGKNINLFVTVSFFQTDILRKNNIIFDGQIKPNFEDGKFLADYFLYTDTQNVAYVKDAIFYYRKRGDGSSTIDNSWLKREKYLNITNYGYLPMLEQYQQKYGKIPKNIQWTIIYEISWHIKTLLNNDYKINILTSDEKIFYYNQIKQVLSYIDDDNIMEFNLIGIWYFHKVGIFGLKDKKIPFNMTYVENIDREKKQILIVSYQHIDTLTSYRIDNEEVLPKYQKIVRHTFAEQLFVHEVRSWIPYDDTTKKISVNLDDAVSALSVFGSQHPRWTIEHILEQFKPSSKYITDGSWLIMDRDTQADDNAEHFYRYMIQNHPEQLCYFALNKDSHDYQRLEKEGFKMLDFGSPAFEHQLRKSSKIISSFFDDYITNYFDDEYEHSKKFVFLQHGITKDDISRWLNHKRNMLGVITAINPEYHYLSDNFTPYQVGKKETFLTGFPRHDNLLKYNNLNSKIILIMPTWRANAIGTEGSNTNERLFNPDFMSTDYAIHWHSLLHSSNLKNLINQYNYEVIFAPHANIQPYLDLFEVPAYIKVWKSNPNSSIQKLFQEAKLMITDYSSVAFEMAVLGKSTLYYQFDVDIAYSEKHTYRKGYFDYEQHGFGAVAETETELLKALEQVLQNNGEPVEPYATRIRETFPFRDGKCCERVYQSIVDLDKPDDGKINVDILLEFIQQAKKHENWQLLEQRLNKLFTLKNDGDIEIDTSIHHDDYLLALFHQNKLLAMLYHLSNQQIKNNTYWLQQINENIHNINPDLQGFIKQHGLVISDVVQKLFELLQKHQTDNLDNLKIYLINILVSQKSWQHLNEIFANQPALQKSMTYEYGLTQCRLGNFYGLDKKLPKPEFGHSYEYWQLMAEIALLNDNVKLQKHCYRGMIAFYPERDKDENSIKLITLSKN